jgi:hypothetical protein
MVRLFALACRVVARAALWNARAAVAVAAVFTSELARLEAQGHERRDAPADEAAAGDEVAPGDEVALGDPVVPGVM